LQRCLQTDVLLWAIVSLAIATETDVLTEVHCVGLKSWNHEFQALLSQADIGLEIL
jgi:hypothetical protein